MASAHKLSGEVAAYTTCRVAAGRAEAVDTVKLAAAGLPKYFAEVADTAEAAAPAVGLAAWVAAAEKNQTEEIRT